MDVYVYMYVYSLFLLPCVGFDELITRPRSPTDCPRLRNWSETKSFMDAPCSSGSQKWNKKRIFAILMTSFRLHFLCSTKREMAEWLWNVGGKGSSGLCTHLQFYLGFDST
jgi:hypothetical protein